MPTPCKQLRFLLVSYAFRHTHLRFRTATRCRSHLRGCRGAVDAAARGCDGEAGADAAAGGGHGGGLQGAPEVLQAAHAVCTEWHRGEAFSPARARRWRSQNTAEAYERPLATRGITAAQDLGCACSCTCLICSTADSLVHTKGQQVRCLRVLSQHPTLHQHHAHICCPPCSCSSPRT